MGRAGPGRAGRPPPPKAQTILKLHEMIERSHLDPVLEKFVGNVFSRNGPGQKVKSSKSGALVLILKLVSVRAIKVSIGQGTRIPFLPSTALLVAY